MRTRALRVMLITDSHGSHVNKKAEAVAKAFADDFKPDLRYHLGDCYDFPGLRNKASTFEMGLDPQPDVEAAQSLLEWYRPTHFIEGNHDWRVFREFSEPRSGIAKDWSRRVIAEHRSLLKGAKYIGYHRDSFMRLGQYRLVHGITHGKNALANAAKLVPGPIIMGHIHASQTLLTGNIDRDLAHSIGCLCDTELDYNRADPGAYRHNTGFAYGLLMPNDTLVFQHAQQTGGRWFIPTEFKEFK